jgi:hypothetical protein
MHGFPSLPFPIIFLLTSTGQTGKPISMVKGSNDAFPPKEVPFLSLSCASNLKIYYGYKMSKYWPIVMKFATQTEKHMLSSKTQKLGSTAAILEINETVSIAN